MSKDEPIIELKSNTEKLDSAMKEMAEKLEEWWSGLPWYKKVWYWVWGWGR